MIPQLNWFPILRAALVMTSLLATPIHLMAGGQTKVNVSPMPPKVAVSGVYRDSAGVNHAWQVNDSHALIWDGKPYLPVGGNFTPHSLSSDEPSAWQADTGALDVLKSKGVQDIIITPAGSLSDAKSANLQRLIDYLEANDFRYGLGFGTGITTRLRGMLIRPTVNRYFEPNGLTATWQTQDADSAYYTFINADKDNIEERSNFIRVTNNIVSVPIEVGNSGERIHCLLYPHITLPAENSLPDLWTGYDSYRDRLLSVLNRVKFGKGLRFFHDPLFRGMSLTGNTDFVVPSSEAFRLEWEGFLKQRYSSIEKLVREWNIGEHDLASVESAVNLVPLWEKLRGAPYLLDMVTGKRYRVLQANKSLWWNDFLECRNNSIRYYMNAAATLLKREVANVPVVYLCPPSDTLFLNLGEQSAIDGFSMSARGTGSSLFARSIAPVYGLVLQNERNLWCMASQVSNIPQNAVALDASNQQSGGFRSSQTFSQAMENLRQSGLKGMYVENLHTLPGSNTASWVAAPDSLGWITDYTARMNEAASATFRPRIVLYPLSDPGPAQTGVVPGSGALWVGTFLPGETIDWWPAFMGYNIILPTGDQETMLISLAGKREVNIFLPDPKRVQAYTPEGTALPIKITGKTSFAMMLDKTPTLLRTGGQRMMIKEAADDAMLQFETLVTVAQGRRVQQLEAMRLFMDRIRTAHRAKDYENAYILSVGKIVELTSVLQNYIWIEGETQTRLNTFDEKARNGGASEGWFLNLANPNDPPLRYQKDGYGVYYDFEIAREGEYDLWLAGSLPAPNISPIVWRLDGPPDNTVAEPFPHGTPYLGDRFGWMKLGRQRLKAGAHTLAVFVPKRAESPSVYSFSIDAVMIAQPGFIPNGSIKPMPLDEATLRASKALPKAQPLKPERFKNTKRK